MKQLIIGIFALSFFASCTPSRDVVYFNELQESRIRSNTQVPETIIQPNDILSISVSSLNAEATEIFNIHNSGPNTETSTGFLVNADGNIQFPVLGQIKVAGSTKHQLQNELAKKLIDSKLLLDPIVLIRFLNFRVTVLGEVNKPTVINVPSEKISLLEAIGTAGDMTIQARRDNVLIIREENDQKVFKRINMNSSELFSSPYYYLKSNDVVYVEPNKYKIIAAKPAPQWIPYALSSLSIIIGLATLLKD
jgi:polysaccharide export outer membrane protein